MIVGIMVPVTTHVCLLIIMIVRIMAPLLVMSWRQRSAGLLMLVRIMVQCKIPIVVVDITPAVTLGMSLVTLRTSVTPDTLKMS